MNTSYDYAFLYALGIGGFAIICGIWARSVAYKKERSPIVWFLIGFFTLLFGVILAYIVPVVHPYGTAPTYTVRRPGEEPVKGGKKVKPAEIHLKRCPHCGAGILEHTEICPVCDTTVEERKE